MRRDRHASLASQVAGLVAGFTLAALAFLTIGVGILFMAVWTCVPQHAIPPKACSPAQIPLAVGLVSALCLLALAAGYRWGQRTFIRRLSTRPGIR